MSINAQASQLIPTMLESVNPELPALLAAKTSKFAQKFNNSTDAHQVSVWAAGTVGSGGVSAYRIPVQISIGGDYQAVNLNGGDLGTGSMMNTAFMTLGAFENDIAYNISTRSIMATKGNRQATANVLKKSLGSAISETALYDEIGLFQAGDGVLMNATAVTGAGTAATSVTYTAEQANFSVNRIRGQGQLVDVTDSAGVMRAVGLRVTNVSVSAGTVTLLVGAVGYSPTATDQIVFPGMGPITTTTIGAGSWRNGIYTFNTTNTAGSLLGLPYATAGEIACPVVNAGAQFFTPSLIYAGKTQLVQRRDDDATNGIIGICHMAQRTSWYLDGLNIATQFIRTGESAKSIDTAGQGIAYGDTFDAGDVTHSVSRYASKSRVDWVVTRNFGRVNYDETQFFTSPEGQRMYVGRSTTTGNPQAGFQFYVLNTNNLYSIDPGCCLVVYNMAIPPLQ